jgi:hypothetical protein
MNPLQGIMGQGAIFIKWEINSFGDAVELEIGDA